MSWRKFEFFAPREEGPIAIAHRGGRAEAGENSLDAFRRATALGLRFIEIDLRATLAGELVVWHGKGIERVRPDLPIDIRRIDREHLVFFEQVLEELPDTRFLVDLKNKQAGEALAAVARRTGTAARICVGSFSHGRTMPAAAAIARETGYMPCTAMTPRQVARLLLHAVRPGREWQSQSVSAQIPAWMATPHVIAAAHSGGALVLAWTVNDMTAMRSLLARGVDGLMTDHPAVLKDVLAERGEWSDRVESPTPPSLR